MKRHYSIYMAAVLPLVAAMVFASCENLMNPPSAAKELSVQAGKASVNITVSDARTVLPEVNADELTYTLEGKKDGGDTQRLAEFTGNGTTLVLEPGNWTFTLNALKGEDIVLSAASVPATLKADQSTPVQFTLKPLKSGTGAINLSFSYPAEAGVTSVKISGGLAETIDLSSVSGTWNYQVAEKTAADYFAIFTFYRKGEVVAVVSEMIQVRYGFTSKKTIPLTIKDNTLGSGWKEGNIAAGGEQWFTFTASAANQFIHVKFGTLTELSVQAYNSASQQIGISNSSLSGGRTYAVLSNLTVGQPYTIRVAPSSYPYGSGDYEIMLSDSPMLEGEVAKPLTSGWNEGDIEAGGHEWFTFTASAANQYVHAKFGALTDLSFQVYDSALQQVQGGYLASGNSTSMNLYNLSVGQPYSVRVSSQYNSSGDYQIAVSESAIPEGTTAKPLESGWNEDNIEAGGEEWFTFTANAVNQYVHVKFGGTLIQLNIQAYNSASQQIGISNSSLSGGMTYAGLSNLTVGQSYTIRVVAPSYYGSGDYEIMLSDSPMLEGEVAKPLASGWNEGDIEAGGHEWFTFTASAANQYVHVKFGTLNEFYVQVYNNALRELGNYNLWGNNTSRSLYNLSAGQPYSIRVSSQYSDSSGDYQIAVSESAIPEGTTAKPLETGWNEGNIEAGGEEWFTFTANAANQFIHVKFGTLTQLNIQAYDSASQQIGISNSSLSGGMTYAGLSNLTVGQSYTIRVAPYGSGDYEIMLSDSPMLEGEIVKSLTSGWNSGSIVEGGHEWFTFTANAANQYVHVKSGTLTDLYFQVYDSALQQVQSGYLGSGNSTSTRLYNISAGQPYSIRVSSQYSDSSGDYEIAVNTSSAPPSP